MNKKNVLVALVIASVLGGVLTVWGGDLKPEPTTLAAVLRPEQKPEKPTIVEKPDEVIEVTVTAARENGAQLYVEYAAKIGGVEVKGSVDAPLDADAETILQLIQSDYLKNEQRNAEKNEAPAPDAAALIGLKDTATRGELYEKFYPTPLPTEVIDEKITP